MTAKEEKQDRFAKIYLDTGDRIEAARAVSKSSDRRQLSILGNRYLAVPRVQDAIEAANTFTLDRAGIAKALTDILTDEKSTSDQKIKAANSLEKVIRYDENDDSDSFQDDFERFLHEYGDILEEFTAGKGDRFEEIFRPRLGKDGKVTFNVKKNKGSSPKKRHEIKKERMIILLKALISRKAFS